MRVLYDHQAFEIQRIGGVSRYFVELLRRDQYAICTIKYSRNENLNSLPRFTSSVKDPDIEYEKFLWGLEFRGKRRLFSAMRVLANHEKYTTNEELSLETIRKGNFDVFHPTYYDPYFLEALHDKPFVVTIYDMIHEKYPELFPVNDQVRHRKSLLLQKADMVIAISENTKKDILDLYSISPSKIKVVYLGSDLKSNGYNKIALPGQYILYTGSRVGYKNFLFFAHAISGLLKKSSELYLVCTGEPFSSDELKFLEALEIASRMIHVCASDDQLYWIYSNARCFVFPSYYEGFGIPILEAFEAGCPVVLAKSSCFPEIALDSALFFDPKNASEMVGAIREILESRHLSNELREKGRRRLLDFSWDKTSELTKEFYKAVV